MIVVTDPGLEACLAKLETLHPQVCPRQVLGVRMGLAAADMLDLRLPRTDKRLIAIVETDGCFADGVSVATGCWLGRRTLRLVDYGKVAVTFVDTIADRTVRVWPDPRVRQIAEDYAPAATSRWRAQLLGYQRMPVEQLLRVERVTLVESITSVVGRPGCRASCCDCGEEINNGRDIATPRGLLCRACATAPYYRVTN